MENLRVNELTKRFGDLVAVDNVSFDISDGEFVSILGPSGSGKSTILRMIAGFERPTSGEVRLQGAEVSDVPPFQRDVNTVFQDLAVFPHMTVAENIAYGLKQQGVKKAERKHRIEDMLEMVRLEGYGDRDPEELSGGEQQRVALARALVNEPEVVLLDEPLASLDRKLRQHMQIELQRIQSETGITFFYVTHDQEVAMSISDRLIVLNEGEIEQIGTPENLFETPQSKFVADFIGDVNILPANVTEASEASYQFEYEDHSFEIDYGLTNITVNGVKPGEPINICIRPNDVDLDGDSPEGWSIDGTVINRIYAGEHITYIVDTGDRGITAKTKSEGYTVGDSVSVHIPFSAMHIFGAE